MGAGNAELRAWPIPQRERLRLEQGGGVKSGNGCGQQLGPPGAGPWGAHGWAARQSPGPIRRT